MKTKISTLLLVSTAITVSFFSQVSAQITPNPGCSASWSSSVGNGTSCTITFTDLSTGTTSNTQYSWDFGDSQTSTAQNPVHTYTASGTYTVCLSILESTSGGIGCKDTLCRPISVQCWGGAIGINDILNEKTIAVYPNPSNGKFQILNKQSVLENLEMVIYNALGERIYSTSNITRAIMVDISSQPEGIYFMNVSSENKESFTQKLIIQK